MKALSVRQPWANLIASGQKTIETRTWYTPYRGELLIASSKVGPEPPLGCAIAVVRLVDCRPMTKADEAAARCRIYDRAYSWVLENVRLVEHVPITGRLALYEVPDDLIQFLPQA